jgi:hypothetical protein
MALIAPLGPEIAFAACMWAVPVFVMAAMMLGRVLLAVLMKAMCSVPANRPFAVWAVLL